MLVKQVTRTYSRSINTKSFGSKVESWIKIEATFTGECESGDDPVKVSEMLHEQAQKDVIDKVSNIIEQIKSANPSTVPANMPAAAQAPTTAPINNPVTTAPVASAPSVTAPRQL